MNYFYIEIKGDVENRAEELITTALAKYKPNTDTTVVKVLSNDRLQKRTFCKIYEQLGELVTVEYLKGKK